MDLISLSVSLSRMVYHDWSWELFLFRKPEWNNNPRSNGGYNCWKKPNVIKDLFCHLWSLQCWKERSWACQRKRQRTEDLCHHSDSYGGGHRPAMPQQEAEDRVCMWSCCCLWNVIWIKNRQHNDCNEDFSWIWQWNFFLFSALQYPFF